MEGQQSERNVVYNAQNERNGGKKRTKLGKSLLERTLGKFF